MTTQTNLLTFVKPYLWIVFLFLISCENHEDEKQQISHSQTRAPKEISSKLISKWTDYKNDLTGFGISYPVDWGVIESSRKDRINLIGPGVRLTVISGINSRKSGNTGQRYSLTLEQAFQEYSAGMKTPKPMKTKAGIAESLWVSFDRSNEERLWLLATVHGECVYSVQASCPKKDLGMLQKDIQKVFDSFKIVRTVTARDVIKTLQKRKPPWEAEALGKSNYEKAQELFAIGRYDEAEKYYKDAIALAPHNPVPRVRLGHLYSFANRWDEVISQGRASQALDKNNVDAFHLLAMGYHGRGQTKLAEANYLHAISLNPNLAVAYYGLAKLYAENYRFQEAAEYARKCISIDPRIQDAHDILRAVERK